MASIHLDVYLKNALSTLPCRYCAIQIHSFSQSEKGREGRGKGKGRKEKKEK
jgi:hypothetical protein